MKRTLKILMLLNTLMIVAACAKNPKANTPNPGSGTSHDGNQSTATPTPSATPVMSPTPTPGSSETPTPTMTPGPTATPTPGPTLTPTPTPTGTPVPTMTPTPTPSGTPAPTMTPTPTSPPPTPTPVNTSKIIINNGDQYTTVTSVSLSLASTEAMQMRISNDQTCSSGVWESYAATKNWTLGLQNSRAFVSAQFKDYDGQPSSCVTANIVHDNAAPEISITTTHSNGNYVGTSTTVTINVEDGGSSVNTFSCSVNSIDINCTAKTFTLSNQQEGSYTISVTATDILGNTTEKHVTYTIVRPNIAVNQNYDIINNNKADIILVIDNSGSMQYEQQSMASRMSTFIDQLSGLDWRVSITTTDPRDITLGDGRFIAMSGLPGGSPAQYYIHSGMEVAVAKAALSATIQRPETGSGQEEGIFATYRALERSKVTADNNFGFVRDQASLHSVIISDEDESDVKTKNIPENLISYVKSAFGDQKKFVFHSIITKPNDNACRTTYGATYGTIYDKLSRLLGFGTVGGAIIGSVCETDYGSQLRGIGQSVQESKLYFDLQCAPVGSPTSSVIVLKDGNNYTDSYEIQGLKIVFASALQPGHYSLSYNCVAP